VLDVLEQCYRDTNAVEKVVQLYELRSRLATHGTERARLLRDAAGLWERELNEPGRAFLCLRQAFEADPQDLSQLEELERIAGVCGAFSELCGLSERVLAGKALETVAKRELALRTAGWYRDFAADGAGEERCLRVALGFDAEDEEVHARLSDLLRERGDRSALMTELRAFAEVDSDSLRARTSLHEAGSLALELSDTELAEACFSRVLELDPEDAAALASLAELKSSAGKHTEATQLLVRWLAVESDPARRQVLHHGVAEAFAERVGDLEQASAAYRALLEEFPDDVRATSALEGIYERLGRWAELERSLRERLPHTASLEDLTEIRLRLARLSEQQLGRPDLAIEQLREVLADAPGHDAAAAEFERLLRQAGQHDELAQWLEERAGDAIAAAEAERARSVLWSLVSLYQEQLGDPERATEALLRLYELRPEAKVVHELVRLYETAGDTARVAEFLELQIELEAPAEAVVSAHRLAELAVLQLGDSALAERALHIAHALAPRDAATTAKLRSHLEASGQYAKIALLLEEDLKLREGAEQVPVLRELAQLHALRLGDPLRGIGYLQRAVALAPKDRELLLALCDLYLSSGREGDAIPVLEQIIASYAGRRAKEVAVFEHRLGRAYEGAGNVDEAFKHYDAAFKIDLTSVPVLRDLGRLCLARGDFDRAQKTYRALLLQKLGEDAGILKADVYYYLGEISARQGDKAKAKAMLERAISEGGKHARASELLAQL
jgi:tetratricopeptide (TPR) repeat protein